MSTNDRGDGCRCILSLQKRTALEYQKKVGIPYYTPGILDHIPLYEKSLQVGITVISARSGNKRVYKGNSRYKLQVTLYHISDEDTLYYGQKRLDSPLMPWREIQRKPKIYYFHH